MAVIKKDGGFMALPINIKRGNPIPLDSTSIWYDYAALVDYAQTGATAYVGQIVTYVNEAENSSTVYVISDAAGTLLEVGSGAGGDAVNVDNNTIVLDDKGLLTLRDFGSKYYRYVAASVDDNGEEVPASYVLQEVDADHPWKAGLIPQVTLEDDGVTFIIGWYEPNPTTVDGLQTAITGLQNTVTALQSNLTNNYYTKEEAQAEFAGALHYRGAVETYDDLALKTDSEAGDVYIVKDTQTEYIYDGDKWEELGNQLDFSNIETRVETLENTVTIHQGNIETLQNTVSGLQEIVGEHTTKIGTLESNVQILQTSVTDINALLGAPASEDGSVAATGVFAQLQEINGKIANFDYISGVTINGTDAPESEGKAQLFDFTQSNGLPGLVPVPSDVVLTAEDIYMLTAKGTWEQPRDTRIGSLTYNDTTYTTVTDYVDARVNNVTMVWSKITE